MLADAINFPLVAIFGLAIFGPLTLLVTVIECLVLKLQLRLGFRAVFQRVLVANIISALAGGLVFGFQDAFIYATGITTSIPAFVHGYTWVSVLLVLIYYAKSAIIEALIIATRSFATKVERSRWSLAKAVVIGNIASYCVVGPLFVFATRPTFGRVEVMTNTRWTVNPDQPVYFIDANDHFIKRVNVSGNGLATIVHYPAGAFLMSADGQAFAYRGPDGNLYAYRAGDSAPTTVWTTQERFLLHGVSLSPDKQRVAYVEGSDPGKNGYETEYRLIIFEISSCDTASVPDFCSAHSFGSPAISWSRDGALIFAQQDSNSVSVFRATPPYELVESLSPASVDQNDLVENHLRASQKTYWSHEDWGCVLDDDSKDEHEVRCSPGLGAHVTVAQGQLTLLQVANDYGLLKLGLPGPDSPSFLPNGSEILLEWWGQIYLLDFEHRRMGLLVAGSHYLLPTRRFQVRFE